MPNRTLFIFALIAAVASAVHLVTAVEVKVGFDKTFDFKSVRTWAWDPESPGAVKMARTRDDDPEAMRKQAEPIIVSAVTTEMGRRKLQPASGAPDIFVRYYLLLTMATTAQTMGQFLPAVPEWGLPPFPPATQSLELANQGALVLDLSSKENVIWRGVARAKIDFGAEASRREGLIREAVRDLLRRFPPKT